MQRVHLIISGDVQGVGFRKWTQVQARKLMLKGWVQNRQDDAVEIVAEGEAAKLDEFVFLCQKGPDVAWVEHVNRIAETATNEFADFVVLY